MTINEHFIKAAKDNLDQFCRFDFVTTNLVDGFQINNLT